MSPVAIDTLLVAQQFQEAGFTRKQSAGATQILATLLTERAGRDETATALSLLAAKIDSLDKRHGAKLDALEAGQTQLRGSVDGMRSEIGGLRTDVDGMRSEIGGLRTDVDGTRSEIGGLRTDVDGLTARMTRIEDLLAKLVDGQAVLLQNDMELKRRLDERR